MTAVERAPEDQDGRYKSLWTIENCLSNPFEMFKEEFSKLENPWKTCDEREMTAEDEEEEEEEGEDEEEEEKKVDETSNFSHFLDVLSDLLSYFEST